MYRSAGIPSLVSIQPSREDSVEICAGADEEENDHEEGLELEDAEHGGAETWDAGVGVCSAVAWSFRARSLC